MQELYWEYNGVKYKRKFKALEAAGRDVDKITCHVFSDKFLTHDFTQEPSESLNELIDIRCHQIRDKYPYIKLWFSGGSDSTTILNGFLRNNIHIDEIIVYMQSLTDNFKHIGNYELTNFTLPYLSNLSKHLTKTKFTDYWVGYDEYRKILTDKWFEKKDNLDLRTMYAPRMRGNNFCNLYGEFSPWVIKLGNRYFDTNYDTTNLTDFTHRNIELFFTSEDLPELHAKQCHIVKNYLKSTGDTRDPKHIARDIVRDRAVIQEHPDIVKVDEEDTVSGFASLKAKAMMKDDPNKELIDRYRFILGTKINNIPVLRLNRGFKIFELDLGE